MVIGGLQKFSLLDYPGHIAAIIFTQGCNFRCQFCYNPMLVWPTLELGKYNNNITSLATANEESEKVHPAIIGEDELFAFLKERQGKLDAVVITGGEPTLHEDLPEFIKKIRKFGYLVKLDTNGTNAVMLKSLIKKKLIDYIAMDIKGPLAKYNAVVGASPDLDSIQECIKIIMNSGLPYEFRTTLVPGLLEPADISAMGLLISGAEKWFLQKFKPDTDILNSSFKSVKPFTDAEMLEMRKVGREYVKICKVR